MERRTFLRLLGLAAPAAVLDPERLLWIPGQKTIFLPSETIFEGPGLLTPEWITREALLMLKNSLTFSDRIHREYDKHFQFGNTVSIPIHIPSRYRVGRG